MQNAMLDKLMTSEAVADYLGITVAGLWKWVRQGDFPPPDIRRPKYSRYMSASVAAAVASLAGRPAPVPPERTNAPRARVEPPPMSGRARMATPATPRAHASDRKRQRYTAEQRSAAVRAYESQVATGKTTVEALGRKLGIAPGSITGWACRARRTP